MNKQVPATPTAKNTARRSKSRRRARAAQMEETQTPSSGAPRGSVVIPNRVFVGGIAYNTTELELKNFFHETFGHVRDSKIITDREGISKGYGFITFDCQSAADEAIEKSTIYFAEKKLNIGPAVRKPNSGQFSRPNSPDKRPDIGSPKQKGKGKSSRSSTDSSLSSSSASPTPPASVYGVPYTMAYVNGTFPYPETCYVAQPGVAPQISQPYLPSTPPGHSPGNYSFSYQYQPPSPYYWDPQPWTDVAAVPPHTLMPADVYCDYVFPGVPPPNPAGVPITQQPPMYNFQDGAQLVKNHRASLLVQNSCRRSPRTKRGSNIVPVPSVRYSEESSEDMKEPPVALRRKKSRPEHPGA